MRVVPHSMQLDGLARAGGVARASRRPALELRDVHRAWRAGAPGCAMVVRALDGVDLTVAPGELVALAGVAGAGKTTLLLCAAGLVQPDAGAVRGDAVGRVAYVGDARGAWAAAAMSAVERGARALLLDVLCGAGAASPRAVAALAGSAAAAGLAVVVAARHATDVPAFARRLVVLAEGRVAATFGPAEPQARRDGARAFVAARPGTP